MRGMRFSFAPYLLTLVILLDQLSKWGVLREMGASPRVQTLIPNVNIALVWNKGVTFGLLNRLDHHMMPYLLVTVGVVIIFMLGRWLLNTTSSWVAFALSLVIGGALSNIIDRLRYGAVVDFIDVYYRDYHWYTFNIADAAIVTGVCLLLLDSLIKGR